MEDKQIQQLLDMLSVDQLKNLYLDFIKEEPEARAKLSTFILKKLRKEVIENPEQLVDQSFSYTTSIGDYWHRNVVRDWEHIDHESYKLFERARKAIASGSPDAALHIGTRWLEDFAYCFDEEEVFYYDEEGFSLRMNCEGAEELIQDAIKHPKVSSEVKLDIAKRLTKLADSKHNPFDDYGFLDIKKLLKEINNTHISDQEMVSVLESLLEETESQVATNESSTEHWLQQLARIHKNLGEKEKTINAYRRLFIATGGELAYYAILKQMIPPQEWTQFLEELVKQTKFSKYSISGKNNYAEILILEELLPILHDWLKDKCKDTNSFVYYLPRLPQELRADLFPIIRDNILALADNASKRDEYERIARLIGKLKELPEGVEIAKGIAHSIKEKYPRKSMFMSELKRTLGVNKL